MKGSIADVNKNKNRRAINAKNVDRKPGDQLNILCSIECFHLTRAREIMSMGHCEIGLRGQPRPMDGVR